MVVTPQRWIACRTIEIACGVTVGGVGAGDDRSFRNSSAGASRSVSARITLWSDPGHQVVAEMIERLPCQRVLEEVRASVARGRT